MSCTKWASRTIMITAVVAALIVAAPPAFGKAARVTGRPEAVAGEAGGWTALLAPWQAVGQWLGSLSAAGSDRRGGGRDVKGDPPTEDDPPACPSQQNPGPCSDPGG